MICANCGFETDLWYLWTSKKVCRKCFYLLSNNIKRTPILSDYFGENKDIPAPPRDSEKRGRGLGSDTKRLREDSSIRRGRKFKTRPKKEKKPQICHPGELVAISARRLNNKSRHPKTKYHKPPGLSF